ncbi:MAG: cell wall-binding repeat-containing protein, partial [Coriobacteriia bacterium]|nr:cell wall-binding repeat-containing protein [Coriobacteriia bacterium]
MNGRARKRVLMRRSTVVFLAALMFAMMLPASAAAFIVVDEIHGNVKDAESEAALPGITVQHLKYNEPPGDYLPMGTDTTDANGYYGFATVTGPLGHRLIFSAASTRYRTAKYTFDYPGFPVTVNHSMRRVAERVAGQSRYSTAVAVARKGYDPDGDKSWPGVDHVVIASGEDRAAADPLAAAGLCWAYDAPLFLVSSKSVSQEVKQAVNEIVTANGPTVVHVVGGPVSVPDPRYTELESAVLGTLHKDRVLATGGRYDLAAAIAQRVKSVAQSNPAKDMPPAVLIANGADSTKFFDALALSAISAGKGCPILLVSADSIPSATRS